MFNIFKKKNTYTIEVNNYYYNNDIPEDILNTNDLELIKNEIRNVINNIDNINDETLKYVNNNYKYYKENDINYTNHINTSNKIMNDNILKNITNINDKEVLIKILKDLKNRLANSKEFKDDMYDKKLNYPIKINNINYTNISNNIINDDDTIENNDIDNKREEIRKNNLDLDPWQIDEIINGNYTEDDFEEEELDEDNYYDDDEE